MTHDLITQIGIEAAMQAETIAARVAIRGYTYSVDLGPETHPRLHIVRKDRSCACALGKDCPAVGAVTEYLRAGGVRAPDPPEDFWFRVPGACPVCAGPTAPDPVLDSRGHGQGWRCIANASHYWEMRARPLIKAQRQAYAASPEVAGLPGVNRQTTEARAEWLEAHRIAYAIWA
jgi:hypothetical protein